MSEVRYIEIYDKNGKLASRIPYTPTEEELKLERAIALIKKLKALDPSKLTAFNVAQLISALIDLYGV